MQDRIPLTDSEWKIMETLWEIQPATIAELTFSLKKETGWQKSTVITLLKRMEQKGAVTYQQGERAKRFFACLRRKDAVLSETNRFLERVYRGSAAAMIRTMLEGGEVSGDELETLRRILAQKE
ncbi:MAG: BlaI/MecI/CopY family transcriptional regulator [Ruminococcus sp.]|nr:BlaI/MecI/CopY family transcriptional regulator [Ruminococcus sp.]